MQKTSELSFCICDSDLEEAQLPLEEYASLREFFVRKLKEGSRPIESCPYCLVTGNKFFSISFFPLLLVAISKLLDQCVLLFYYGYRSVL